MRTVLLTADMIPLRHIPVEEAIIKIVKGSVYAVENHPSRVFRSQHMEIPAPLMVASYRHVSLPDHFYGPATLTNENLLHLIVESH